jgi:hypothetical protein
MLEVSAILTGHFYCRFSDTNVGHEAFRLQLTEIAIRVNKFEREMPALKEDQG